MQGCVYTCMILVSWLGAKQIVIGTMSTGNLMSFFTYIMQILSSLMMLSMVFVMITMSRASAERIVEVLNEQSDITNCDDPVYKVKDGSIQFTDVCFSYAKRPDKTVLDDIDLVIPSGQTVGIIGGTGSSKSSLVQLIPRLYDATGGSVKVGGIDVRRYDLQTLRHNVAMVLQKNTLFSGTIKDNLRWATRTQPMRSWCMPASWRRLMILSERSPTDMRLILSRGAPMFRADRSSACALRAPFCANQRS